MPFRIPPLARLLWLLAIPVYALLLYRAVTWVIPTLGAWGVVWTVVVLCIGLCVIYQATHQK